MIKNPDYTRIGINKFHCTVKGDEKRKWTSASAQSVSIPHWCKVYQFHVCLPFFKVKQLL